MHRSTPVLSVSILLSSLDLAAQPAPDPRHLELASGEVVDLSALGAGPAKTLAPDLPVPWVITFHGAPNPAWQQAIRAAGGEIAGFLPPAGFQVRADAQTALRLAALPGLAALAPFAPAWKVAPELARATKALPASGETRLRIEVLLFAGAEADGVLARIWERGVELSRRLSLGRLLVTAEVPSSLVAELAERPEVQWLDAAARGIRFNDSVRVVMQTERQHFTANQAFYNPVYGIGVNGSTQIIGFADTGIRWSPTHEQFTKPGKVTYYGAPDPTCGVLGDLYSHGTGVVNTAAGDSLGPVTATYGTPNGYDGVAYAARLYVQDVFDDNPITEGEFCENLDPIADILKPAYAAGAKVHNNSWGHAEEAAAGAVPRGKYSLRSQELDAHLKDPAYRESVVVFAVGNFGTWPWDASGVLELRTLSDEAHAKNVIAVGGSRDEDLRNQMYTYSGRGPTNDCNPANGVACTNPGRVKPDVVAPASWTIHSAESGASNAYCPLGPGLCEGGYFGTSFAAPAISGAAALVRDYFAKGKYPNDPSDPPLGGPPSSALVKAMLVNATVFLNDASAYQATVASGAPANAYPNYDQGYGRPALDNVLEPAGFRKLKVFEDGTTKVATGELWSRSVSYKDLWHWPCNVLRITLAWADEPGTPGIQPVLVNDLDLEVTFKGVTYFGNFRLNGNQPDRLNNVEDVFLPLGTQPWGALISPVVKVRGARVMSAAPQPFAVVATYGTCFDNTPCILEAPGGCYRGPGDTVPGPHGWTSPGCGNQWYSTGECLFCGQDPWPTCQPPTPPVLIKPVGVHNPFE